MLIIGINGSPNKKGNTMFLLEEALSEARSLGAETEVIHCAEVLKDLKVPFCQHCSSPCASKCYEGKEIEKAYTKLSRCDGILLGSPVYFGTVTAQMKAFWDLSRALRSKKTLLNVIGGAITVGASRFGGQETTLRALHDIMLVQGMIVVGDGYIDDDCGHQGVAAQRPSESDQYARQRAKILGKRMFRVCASTTSLRIR